MLRYYRPGATSTPFGGLSLYHLGNNVLVASGSVTQANMRLSVATGGSFWWAEGTDLSAYAGGNHLLALSDSSGRALLAYTGAVGTGEAKDPNALANGDFTAWTGDNPDGWTVSAETGSCYITQAGNAARIVSDGGSITAMESVLVAGALYYCSLQTVAEGSGQALFGPVGAGYLLSSPTPGATVSGYRTAGSDARWLVGRYAACDVTFTAANAQKVTAPSASGFALRNASGLGGAQSILSETTGFNRNDSSGYTYKIFYIGA